MPPDPRNAAAPGRQYPEASEQMVPAGPADHDTTPRYDLVGRLDHAVRTLDTHRAELARIAAEIAVVRDDLERVGTRGVAS